MHAHVPAHACTSGDARAFAHARAWAHARKRQLSHASKDARLQAQSLHQAHARALRPELVHAMPGSTSESASTKKTNPARAHRRTCAALLEYASTRTRGTT
eukprot:3376860-Pleurochrysis_carterae.AAC.2